MHEAPRDTSEQRPSTQAALMGKTVNSKMQQTAAPPVCSPSRWIFHVFAFLFFVFISFGHSLAAAETLNFTDCADCHGTDIHSNVDHTSSPGGSYVTIFADYTHDSVNWDTPSPQFHVFVNCSTCHTADLKTIHANDCVTCHSTPYNTVKDNWQRGCQQGGCHTVYHADSITAHDPFEWTGDPANDCTRCHNAGSWEVVQSNCLNCHATYGPTDSTPPVTTSNALPSYIGPAFIDFSMRDNNDKVGIGRTYYTLDSGPEIGQGKVFVTAPGAHVLEFWSVDQSGNVETTRKSTSFTITEDVTPPSTTSDAASNYYQGGTITLTATDNSTLGVKATYYSLDGGPTQTGTSINVPTLNGTHTLVYWSVDWAGNIESQRSVTFTVVSGTGTIRLVWGNSDSAGSPCPGDPEANAAWTIYKGGSWSGQIVNQGSGGCPDWSGVNDVSVPVDPAQYLVVVDWYDSYWGFDDQSVFYVSVTAPGQTIRLSY